MDVNYKFREIVSRKPAKEVCLVLSPEQLVLFTSTKRELSKIGLDSKNLLAVLREVSNLNEGEVSSSDVRKMLVPKKYKRKTAINSLDMIFMLRQAGFIEEAKKIEIARIPLLNLSFLQENGMSKLLPKLAFSTIVLSRIKISQNELIMLEENEKVWPFYGREMIRVNLGRYQFDEFLFQSCRTNRCPFKKKCEILFDKISDKGFNITSCIHCDVHRAAEKAERLDYFKCHEKYWPSTASSLENF